MASGLLVGFSVCLDFGFEETFTDIATNTTSKQLKPHTHILVAMNRRFTVTTHISRNQYRIRQSSFGMGSVRKRNRNGTLKLNRKKTIAEPNNRVEPNAVIGQNHIFLILDFHLETSRFLYTHVVMEGSAAAPVNVRP